jgi:hypothetical protein
MVGAIKKASAHFPFDAPRLVISASNERLTSPRRERSYARRSNPKGKLRHLRELLPFMSRADLLAPSKRRWPAALSPAGRRASLMVMVEWAPHRLQLPNGKAWRENGRWIGNREQYLMGGDAASQASASRHETGAEATFVLPPKAQLKKVENDRQRIAISFWRLKPGRSEPFLHVKCYLDLTRASQQPLTFYTGRSALSFLAQSLCLFVKPSV